MVYVQWKRHLEQIVLKKLTVGVCMCMHTLNAYGSSVTQLVSCLTPILRGHHSSANWLSS